MIKQAARETVEPVTSSTEGRNSAAAGDLYRGLSPQEVHRALNREDGTRQLLVSGVWIAIFGLFAMLPVLTLFGGVGPQGAHSNAGWLSLMVALMSEPFGVLLLALGGAKWLRNRSLSRRGR